MLTLTREELYKQVWSKPTIELAKEYGVSDVAIAKVCKKHNIPKPPLGYWAKIQHGHKVRRPALPPLDDPDLQTIHINPLPEYARPQPVLPEAKGKMRAERSEESRIIVPDTLDSPHPLVRRTERSLRAAKPDECGIVRPNSKGCLDVGVGKDSVDRAMRIMDALIRAVETRGMRVVVHDEEYRSITHVDVEGETMDLRLTEMLGERERQLTPEQKRENEEYSILKPHSTTEKYPRGLLVLSVAGRFRYNRHRCTESEGKPLEDRLNDLVAWLYKEADRIRERRRQQEEQERQWAEERKRREEEERRRREEEERVKQLESAMSAWHKAQRMRAYVTAVEETAIKKSGPVDPNSELGRWLTWARNHIAKVDPIKP